MKVWKLVILCSFVVLLGCKNPQKKEKGAIQKGPILGREFVVLLQGREALLLALKYGVAKKSVFDMFIALDDYGVTLCVDATDIKNLKKLLDKYSEKYDIPAASILIDSKIMEAPYSRIVIKPENVNSVTFAESLYRELASLLALKYGVNEQGVFNMLIAYDGVFDLILPPEEQNVLLDIRFGDNVDPAGITELTKLLEIYSEKYGIPLNICASILIDYASMQQITEEVRNGP